MNSPIEKTVLLSPVLLDARFEGLLLLKISEQTRLALYILIH
jgi:hypothetical protein